MRILELEIQNIRGIRSLLLQPQGENLVIWGPNGSGKSAVVDAIDFLLTGRISRLTGRGTAGINLARHGPHIDSDPSEAVVRAVLQVPGVSEPVELSRCIGRPALPELDPPVQEQLAPILELASRGQHVLTRREILKYVTMEARTRAEEIQGLLNLASAETVRRALVTVHHQCRDAAANAGSALREAHSRVSVLVGIPQFDLAQVLAFINEQRHVLGGAPIASVHDGGFHTALRRPEGVARPQVDIAGAEPALRSLRALLAPEIRDRRQEAATAVGRLVRAFRSNPALLDARRRRQLLQLGLSLIDDAGACPLCETVWTPGDLATRIQRRLGDAEIASVEYDELSTNARVLCDAFETCGSALGSILRAVTQLAMTDLEPHVRAWALEVQRMLSVLDDPIGRFPPDEDGFDAIASLLAPSGATDWLSRIDSAIIPAPSETTREQTAWDRLTQLAEAFVRVESEEPRVQLANLAHRRAARLLEAYENARNEVLNGLYTEVRDRFVQLYRELHESHEGSFTAELAPEGAGLDFLVDFYGRGVHPPQALHSEGHQDSMGICLYLALAERLSGDLINLTILDDVMMSVDAGHRRQVCRLLAGAFPGRQLIITTHDRTWANQLRTEGVVTTSHSVQFYAWDLSTGPRVLAEQDLLDRIRDDMSKGDVPGAAHRLRRGSEAYFSDVCDAIWAPVRFRLSGRWEFGDLVLGAMRHYRRLLRLAKAAANSWNRSDVVDALSDVESTAGQVFARTQAEQWAVNENVHYNAWADFSPSDFAPVVEAFADLFDVFRCADCGTLLRVVAEGPKPVSLQCNCGVTAWGLQTAAGS